MTGRPWAVILAGGDGNRVSVLTQGRDGKPTPKQYCRFGGGTPMVRWAVNRARTIVPLERVLVVVSASHRRFWEAELADVPARNLLVQPSNKGTAAGVLFALLTVRIRADASSPVVFLPSDHYVANEGLFCGAAVATVEAAARDDVDVVLLGAEPGVDCHDCGWILPERTGTVARVRRFVEKPPHEHLERLRRAGGILNTFVFAAQAQRFVNLFERTLPALTGPFRLHCRYPAGVIDLHALYDAIPATDLSRDVLQHAGPHLAVVRAPDCGWSDLGTPARLEAFTRRSDFAPPMRMRRAVARAVAAA